jgi:hypothetical protein
MSPKNSTPKQKSKLKTPSTAHPLPNWPPLKPLLPASSLSPNSLVPSQIITIHHFWTSALCKTYVQFLKGLPLTTTPGKPKKGEALRFNDRLQVWDEGFARMLWVESGLREVLFGETGDFEGMTAEERRALW